MQTWSKWLPPLVLLLAVRPGAAAEGLPSYLPPETKVLLGIQVRGIVDALQGAVGGDLRKASATLLAQSPLEGFDPIKDLDEIVIAASGTDSNAPVLAFLRGRFDLAKLTPKGKKYGGVTILEGGASAKGVIALLDENTALAGEMQTVRAAIDRRLDQTRVKLPWAARAAELSGKYTVWGLGSGMAMPKNANGQPSPLDSMDAFEFGAQYDGGLGLVAKLHLRSAEDAKKLTAALQMMQAMTAASPASNGTQFQMSSEGGTVSMSVRIPEAELKKAVQAQSSALQAAVLSQLPAGLSGQLAAFTGAGVAAAPVATRPPATSHAVPASASKITAKEDGETLVVTLPGAAK